MAEFQLEIGDTVGDFEVVSRASNDNNDELQYTIVSKAHADERRKAAEAVAQRQQEIDAAPAESAPETPAEVAAPAAASEEPQTLLPR